MLELIDEIGREHVEVLRFVAQDDSDVLVHVMVDGTMHESGSFRLRGRDQRGMDALLGGKAVRPLDILQSVFDVLMAHGMLVVDAVADGVNNVEVGPPIVERETAPVVLNLHRARLSARGKDFMSRRLLVHALSMFSAKTNKNIALVVAAIGVLGGIAGGVTTVINLVRWLQ